MDSALQLRYERIDRVRDWSFCIEDWLILTRLAWFYDFILKPPGLVWDDWVEGHMSKIKRSIPVLADRDLPDPNSPILRLDGISAAIALYYIDRRAKDA